MLIPGRVPLFFTAQVVGRKLVWVGPPSCKVGMYCFGASTPSPPPTSPRTSPHRKTPERKGPEEDPAVPDWQSLQSNSDSTASTAEDKGVDLTAYMTNTSRVDVFSSVPTVEDEFPRFTDEVEPEAMWTVLEPGDMLFLPPLWYHGMKSLERVSIERKEHSARSMKRRLLAPPDDRYTLSLHLLRRAFQCPCGSSEFRGSNRWCLSSAIRLRYRFARAECLYSGP